MCYNACLYTYILQIYAVRDPTPFWITLIAPGIKWIFGRITVGISRFQNLESQDFYFCKIQCFFIYYKSRHHMVNKYLWDQIRNQWIKPRFHHNFESRHWKWLISDPSVCIISLREIKGIQYTSEPKIIQKALSREHAWNDYYHY